MNISDFLLSLRLQFLPLILCLGGLIIAEMTVGFPLSLGSMNLSNKLFFDIANIKKPLYIIRKGKSNNFFLGCIFSVVRSISE